MLVVYILTKAKELKVKVVRDTSGGMFSYKDFEYKIDRKKIYQKKFLGFRNFFFSFYLEGNGNPLEFDDSRYNISPVEVPLDEIAVILRKIRRGMLEILMIVLTAGIFLMVLAVLVKVYEVQ